MNIGRNSVSVLEELHHVGWRPLHKCNVMGIFEKIKLQDENGGYPEGFIDFWGLYRLELKIQCPRCDTD